MSRADALDRVLIVGEPVRTFLDGAGGTHELVQHLATAADKGITAVPTYVIDGRWTIPGAQDPAVFVQVLRRLSSAARAG